MRQFSSLLSTREIVNAAFKDRVKILAVFGATVAIAILVILLSPARYVASSSLLVLPSTQYAAKNIAGDNTITNESLNREEILQTEIEILSSTSLHADVIRTVGLANIYPKMAEPPGLFAQAMSSIKGGIIAIKRSLGLKVKPPEPDDPNLEAVPVLNDNLSFLALKQGSIVQVSFSHKDPDIAAQVVNTLINKYLERRRAIYASNDSTYIHDRAMHIREELDNVDRKAAAFKLEHSVYDFVNERALLLTHRGELEKGYDDAQNLASQSAERVTTLDHQLASLPKDITLYSERDTNPRTLNLNASLDTLLVQKSTLIGQFGENSRPISDINNSIKLLRDEIQRTRDDPTPTNVRNGHYDARDTILADRMRAAADLTAAQQSVVTTQEQLKRINARLERLNQNEEILAEFDRQTQVLTDDYKDVTKALSDQRVSEEVRAGNAANVRPIAPALPPLSPEAVWPFILVAGIILGVTFGVIAGIVSDARRPSFISAEKLERTLGLTVLVSIPERAG